MRKLIAPIIILLSVYSFAWGEVDTLRLDEQCVIQTPDPISEFFLEEFTGDGQKDLLITTGTHIYIYDGANNSLFWTSPLINCPGEMKFADFDGDGIVEIICRSGFYLYVFNPLNQTPYWVSPYLGDTYRIFGVGDRNEDGYDDIVILRQESFSRPYIPGNADTVWVDTYDGPQLNQGISSHFLLQNYFYFNELYQTQFENYETPVDIIIDSLSGSGYGTIIGILASTDHIETFITLPRNPGGKKTGSFIILRGNDLSLANWIISGINHLYKLMMVDSSRYLVQLSEHFYYGMLLHQPVLPGHYAFRNIFSCNGFVSCDTFEATHDDEEEWPWRGAIMGDLKPLTSGHEICYGYIPYLTLDGLESGNRIWRQSVIADHDTVFGEFKISAYSSPQICIQNRLEGTYRLYDGSTGNLRAVFSVPDYLIDEISDYDNDGNDEIFTIRTNNLRIYSASRVSINQEPSIPETPFAAANYPNPFNDATVIEYYLPNSSIVKIEVFDIAGRKTNTLLHEYQAGGKHELIWEAKDLPSGLYFYKITAGEKALIKKAILLK